MLGQAREGCLGGLRCIVFGGEARRKGMSSPISETSAHVVFFRGVGVSSLESFLMTLRRPSASR